MFRRLRPLALLSAVAIGSLFSAQNTDLESCLQSEDTSLPVSSEQASVKKVKVLTKRTETILGESIETPPAQGERNDLFGIIINGDYQEKRHRRNVERASRAMREIGMPADHLYVTVSSTSSTDTVDGLGEAQKFPSTPDGVQDLFAAVGNQLAAGEGQQKQNEGVLVNNKVLVYVTGHGTKKDGIKEGIKEGIAIALEEGCFGMDAFVSAASIIPANNAQGIFVLDQCYSGTFPSKLIEGGIRGEIMSPGLDGEETSCQYFSLPFWTTFREEFPNDPLHAARKAFSTALANYDRETGILLGGSYRRSVPELTLENYDEMIEGGNVIVDINATWCGYCKKMSGTLDLLQAVLDSEEDQLRVVKLTKDTNSEYGALSQKLEVQAEGMPTLVYLRKDGQREVLIGARTAEQLEQQVKTFFDMELSLADLGYASRFDTAAAEKLRKNGVNSTIANGYNPRFSAVDIIKLVWKEVRSAKAEEYDSRFSGVDIARLVRDNVPNREAVTYDAQFTGADIAALWSSGVENAKAMAYPIHLSGFDIAQLVTAGISEEVVSTYPEGFLARDIIDLERVGGVSAIQGYDERFGPGDIAYLAANRIKRIDPEIANGYEVRFDASDVYDLALSEVPNSIAVEYAPRFDGGEIAVLYRADIEHTVANGFDVRFSGDSIAKAKELGINSEQSQRYDERFTNGDIESFVWEGVWPRRANKYSEEFSGRDIAHLHDAKISQKKASRYDGSVELAEFIEAEKAR